MKRSKEEYPYEVKYWKDVPVTDETFGMKPKVKSEFATSADQADALVSGFKTAGFKAIKKKR